jgi:hypothetical protein
MFECRKVRAIQSMSTLSGIRRASLSESFAGLAVCDSSSQKLALRGDQAFPKSRRDSSHSIILSQMAHVTLRPTRKDTTNKPSTVRRKLSYASLVALPQTPTPSARQMKTMLDRFEDTVKSAFDTPRSPSKSTSPSKLPFLTKESNLTGFIAWDVDERLQEVESQFKGLKEMMNSTVNDRRAMEDAVELAKTRGKLHVACWYVCLTHL